LHQKLKNKQKILEFYSMFVRHGLYSAGERTSEPIRLRLHIHISFHPRGTWQPSHLKAPCWVGNHCLCSTLQHTRILM
jgi:hypothetical protein